jgi:hypothetical protein
MIFPDDYIIAGLYHQEPNVLVYHADCRDILPLLPANSISAIITDPVWPNSLDSMPGADRPFELFAEVAKEFPRLAKTTVIHLGCSSDPRFLTGIPREMPYFRTCWLRYQFPSRRGRLLIGSDVAYAFGVPPKSRRGNHLIPGEINSSDREMSIAIKKRKHPCPRKIEHVLGLVNIFTNPDDIILDPFGGSLTTAAAAKILGRKCITIELIKKHLDNFIDRLAQEELFCNGKK